MNLPLARRHLATIAHRLHRARALDVAVDFDGTVSPIVPEPGRAAIDPLARAALARLARTPRTRVAVLSGRRLPDLRRRVAIRGAYLVGGAGLEVPGRARVDRSRNFARRHADLYASLAGWALRFPRAWIEPKGEMLALHFGLLGPAERTRYLAGIRRRLAPWRRVLAVTRGTRSIDLAPLGSADKGVALRRWTSRRGGGTLLVCLGDDANDLPALAFARRVGGLTLAVGRPLAGAGFRLGDTSEAAAFLAWLARAWAARVSASR